MALSTSEVALAMAQKFTSGGVPVSASDIQNNTVDPNVKDVLRELLKQLARFGLVLPSLPEVP